MIPEIFNLSFLHVCDSLPQSREMRRVEKVTYIGQSTRVCEQNLQTKLKLLALAVYHKRATNTRSVYSIKHMKIRGEGLGTTS